MLFSLLWIIYIFSGRRTLPTTTAFRLVIVPFRIENGALKNRHRYTSCRTFMAFQQQLGTFEELRLQDESSTGQSFRHVLYYDFTTTSTTSIALPILSSRDKNSSVVPLQPGTLIEYNKAWDLQKVLLQSHLDRLSMIARAEKTRATTTCGNKHNEIKDVAFPSPFLSSFLPLELSDDSKQILIGVDTILFVEHDPVYTLGTGSDVSFIRELTSSDVQDPKSQNLIPPIVRIDRGGEVTYHGPGQLTVYPIIDLRNYNQDIHWYVRALEEVVIRAINRVIQNYHGETQLVAKREENITGVWINDFKVAAIGVKCKKWITQHGFAINVTPESLDYIDNIVPCGLVGRKVGYVNQFLPHPITVSQMTKHIIGAFEDVFQIRLEP